MKKVMKVLAMVMVVAMVAVVPVYAAPYINGFYAGFQVGPNFTNTYSSTLNGFSTPNAKFNPGVAVGAQVGYDFAYLPNAPKFAKYFGVGMDYMYNGLATKYGFQGGSQNALSFLGVVKYPLMADKNYPGGRVAPYVAAGPGVVWTNLAGANATSAALVVEPGVRFMMTPRVSVDAAYRFRYLQTNFTNNNVKTKTNFNNNMFLVKANVHF
jgi:hypothetical protein